MRVEKRRVQETSLVSSRTEEMEVGEVVSEMLFIRRWDIEPRGTNSTVIHSSP